MLENEEFDYFFGEGYVTRLIRPVSSGKEASVYLCRATRSIGGGLLALKVYRNRNQRNFKNDQISTAGRVILNAHDRRAVARKSHYGRATFDRLMWNVEMALRRNLIHADLSPFNVLWWEGRATIIDLPQAVDARSNPNASALLARDVSNLCRHFHLYGVRADPDDITRGLWMGFLFADL